MKVLGRVVGAAVDAGAATDDATRAGAADGATSAEVVDTVADGRGSIAPSDDSADRPAMKATETTAPRTTSPITAIPKTFQGLLRTGTCVLEAPLAPGIPIVTQLLPRSRSACKYGGGWWQIGLWAGLVVIAEALLMFRYLRFLVPLADCD